MRIKDEIIKDGASFKYSVYIKADNEIFKITQDVNTDNNPEKIISHIQDIRKETLEFMAHKSNQDLMSFDDILREINKDYEPKCSRYNRIIKLLEKFDKGKEMYQKSPMFNMAIQMLLEGRSQYEIIEHMATSVDRVNNAFSDYIERDTRPPGFMVPMG